MSIPAKQYDVIYRGAGQAGPRYPGLVPGEACVVYVAPQRGWLALTLVSRIGVEANRVMVRGRLGLSPQLYAGAEALAADWTLTEWPFNWPALRDGLQS